MMKRMTLLAKKEGMATSDFRAYWAGPHARLALGMEGITKYIHNRVDKVLWSSAEKVAFTIDGMVELYFADAEAMRLAQTSAVGQKFIPADEPLFLKGWTLCVVDVLGSDAPHLSVKVLIPFHADADVRELLWSELRLAADAAEAKIALNWTVSTAKRERLWSELNPPNGIVSVWFNSVAKAHKALESGSVLCSVLEKHTSNCVAYLIDELIIR